LSRPRGASLEKQRAQRGVIFSIAVERTAMENHSAANAARTAKLPKFEEQWHNIRMVYDQKSYLILLFGVSAKSKIKDNNFAIFASLR
jgi:hypothetical protein